MVSRVGAGVTGNNSLQSLAVSPGTLTPAFNANTQDYTVDVATTVASITVTSTLSDPAVALTVNQNPMTSGQASTIFINGPGQSTAIPIVATALNGNPQTYTITVGRGYRDDDLRSSECQCEPANQWTANRLTLHHP